MAEFGVYVAVIMGVVEVLKRTGLLDSKWAGVVAVVLGIAGTLLPPVAGVNDGSWFDGVVAGLTAAGAYSGAKALGR